MTSTDQAPVGGMGAIVTEGGVAFRVWAPHASSVSVMGDFNDWRQRANHPLKVDAGLEEIFTRANGRPARTFPVRFPLLRLDRIYVKNAHASSPTALALLNWRHLSDHAPLSAEIHL